MNKKYLVTVKDIFSGDELDRFLVVGEIYDLENREIVEKTVSEIANAWKSKEYDYEIEHLYEDEIIYLEREQTNESFN